MKNFSGPYKVLNLPFFAKMSRNISKWYLSFSGSFIFGLWFPL